MSASDRSFLKASTEASIVLAVFDLANHLQRGGERLAASKGLTTQQWLVLLQIAGDPNFPNTGVAELASDIARERGVSRPTISAVIAKLRQLGLIKEQPHPDDARKRKLQVTPRGLEALRAIEPTRDAANHRLLRELSSTRRRRLLHELQVCLGTLWELYEDRERAKVEASPRRARSR